MDTYYIDGEFVREDKATVSVKDLSVLRGYGVFDFLRSYNGIPFCLRDHIARLANSARLIGLILPMSLQKIYELTMETIRRNEHAEFNVRIVVTGGISSTNYTPDNQAQLIIMVTAVSILPAEYYSKGIKIITSKVDRFMPGSKSINYIPAILAMQEAKDRGAAEAIYVDRNGYIQEGTTSNFFALFGNKLVTPPLNRILPGITREKIIELAKDLFTIEVRPVHQDEIRLMDEAFITASNKEIMPVRAIDAVTLTDGPGEKTHQLMQLFKQYTSQYCGE